MSDIIQYLEKKVDALQDENTKLKMEIAKLKQDLSAQTSLRQSHCVHDMRRVYDDEYECTKCGLTD